MRGSPGKEGDKSVNETGGRRERKGERIQHSSSQTRRAQHLSGRCWSEALKGTEKRKLNLTTSRSLMVFKGSISVKR